MSPLGLTLIIILVILLILGVIFLFLRRVAAKRARAVRERFPNARLIIPSANFFGQESLGGMQGRGNGTLALTDNELYFERWVLRKEYHIPLSAIQSVETTMSHLGKSIFRPLLKVVYINEMGNTDSIAWYVPDVEGVKRALEEARR